MKIRALILIALLLVSANTHAGGLGGAVVRAVERGSERAAEKAAERTAESASAREAKLASAYARDAARDAATPARETTAERTVQRYTSAAQAKRDQTSGVQPGSHMTPNVPRGRGITAERAAERYGLNETPEVVETVVIPKGQPIRSNKALGGEAGRGEVTSTKAVKPAQIRAVRVLPNRQRKSASDD
jgi:hypothetical protein